jgi:hypothetical protein
MISMVGIYNLKYVAFGWMVSAVCDHTPWLDPGPWTLGGLIYAQLGQSLRLIF